MRLLLDNHSIDNHVKLPIVDGICHVKPLLYIANVLNDLKLSIVDGICHVNHEFLTIQILWSHVRLVKVAGKIPTRLFHAV